MTDPFSKPEQPLSPEITAMMGVYALYWKLEESIDSVGAESNLTRNELHMIIRLEQPKRMGVLAEDMLTAPSSITSTADSLERAGILARHPDPNDRRACLLQLTDNGETTRRALVAASGELFRSASGLASGETRQFARLAAKIRENIISAGIPAGLKS